MNKIVGYSVYLNQMQDDKYRDAYTLKSKIVEESQKVDEAYGVGLTTILIFYIFETLKGDFDKGNFKTTISRYKPSDKSIRVTFYIGHDDFETKSISQQIQFYYQTTIEALNLVKDKIEKRMRNDVEIDFTSLTKDIHAGFQNFTGLD